MLLSNFATRTETIKRNNIAPSEVWPIGIDYGYSGIKCFSPNKVFCFPNAAILQPNLNILESSPNDIILKDKTGTWCVGEKANAVMTPEDAYNYESEMFNRNRYFSPSFGALMKAGLGIALTSNNCRKYNGETIVIQTGLPPKYRNRDSVDFIEALSGEYDFDLKLGLGPFQHFHFIVNESNVSIMDQPMGSLISAITANDGRQMESCHNILKSNTLIFDPGFLTLDIFDISNGMVKDDKGSQTYDTLGMHEVFKRTVEELNEKYNAAITIPGMQSALRSGYIKSFDRRQMRSAKVDFTDIMARHSSEVCNEAIQKVLSVYGYLQHHDYLVVTGGTGNAWFDAIESFFQGMDLNILSANKNDPSLSNIYSNVRGYYYYLVGRIFRSRR